MRIPWYSRDYQDDAARSWRVGDGAPGGEGTGVRRSQGGREGGSVGFSSGDS